MSSSKDFSIVTRILMDTAGFTTGKDKITSEGKAMEKAITSSSAAMSDGFGKLANNALPQLAGQFGMLGGVMNSMKSIFGNLVKAAATADAAIISTGIGAVIIAITLAIAGLISWMKRTDEGGDKMKAVWNSIKAVLEVVMEKLALLGKALYEVTTGDYASAWNDLKDAFTGWGKAIDENIAKGKALSDADKKLAEFNVTYLEKRSVMEADIADKQLEAHKKQESNGNFDNKANEQLKALKTELYYLDLKQIDLEINAAQLTYNMGAKTRENLQKVNDLHAKKNDLYASYSQSLRENEKLDNKNLVTTEAQLVALKKINELKEGGNTGVKVGGDYYGKDKKLHKAGEADTSNVSSALREGGIGVTSQITAADKELKKYGGTLKEVLDLNNKYADAQERMADAVQGFANSIKDGANSFKEFGKTVASAMKQAIAGLLSATIAQAIEKSVAFVKNPLIGLALGSLAGGLAATLFNSLVPSFATGGIMPNTGYALVGENGPELAYMGGGTRIFNNNETRNMMGGGQVTFRIEGTTLIGVLNNQNRTTNGFA